MWTKFYQKPKILPKRQNRVNDTKTYRTTKSSCVLSEFNIWFWKLVPKQTNRGPCCGPHGFGTSSRSFLKSVMVLNFVFGWFVFFALKFCCFGRILVRVLLFWCKFCPRWDLVVLVKFWCCSIFGFLVFLGFVKILSFSLKFYHFG